MGLALLLSLGIALFVERCVFWDGSAINDDVRNQAYWMLRLVDPALYPQDVIADYFTQPSLISPVVQLLYTLAARLGDTMDPLRFSQWLPFPLILLTTFFLFRFAERCVNARYAFWACGLFNLFIWTVRVFAGGLPRAFFYPLLFLFLWQYEKKAPWGIILALCLGALIYPPVGLLGIALLCWYPFGYLLKGLRLFAKTARFQVVHLFSSHSVLATPVSLMIGRNPNRHPAFYAKRETPLWRQGSQTRRIPR